MNVIAGQIVTVITRIMINILNGGKPTIKDKNINKHSSRFSTILVTIETQPHLVGIAASCFAGPWIDRFPSSLACLTLHYTPLAPLCRYAVLGVTPQLIQLLRMPKRIPRL